MKVFIIMFLAFLLMLTTAVSAENTGDELERDIERYQDEQYQTEQEAESTEEELRELEEEMAGVEDEIRDIDDDMIHTGHEIQEQESDIEATTNSADELRSDILQLEDTIENRDEQLRERVRSMHQSGGVNYIEVILGAKSFGDLIERLSILHNIAEQDRRVIDAHIEDMDSLEDHRAALENQLAELEKQKEELEVLQADLERQTEEKQVLLEELNEQGYMLEENLLSLEEERELLAAQEDAARQELTDWEEEQERLEEERRLEEQRRQEEQERRAREAAEEAERVEEAAEAEAAGAADVSETTAGPVLHRPADGRVTSDFNPERVHPIHGDVRPHRGIDYGRDGGLNIYAAESGTVISASRMSGFGNTVLISHRIGGQEYTTLYAHLASMDVSAGDRVERGEVIAEMGTTGVSTGVHLHFEVHPGGYSGGSSAVNPNPYLP
ncbi:murein hydrolase activator EnvC family protein [Alkalicoccus chagannorensis]|uniref:murein hydrolase activator EnvC family protein n=1 Tax=Alkalicoccus chagannorensis TaxID=427072 RepID=UPI00040C4EE6|nr:peptidoglycan DD-metalloendopeptidase family protein [Alkalicoccus chagannorensis]